jgi:replicative DNA helicase
MGNRPGAVADRREVERQVIGALILRVGVGCRESGLSPEDFAFDRHREMFEALQVQESEKLVESGDAVALWNSSGVPVAVWNDLAGCVVTSANLPYWVGEMKRHVLADSEKRERAATAAEVMAGKDPALIAGSLQDRLETLRGRYGATVAPNAARRASQALMEQIVSREPPKLSVRTGIAPIDRLLFRAVGGDYIVLAARPSVGKTALALNIAGNLADRGEKSCFISLEMSATQLMARQLAGIAGVDVRRALLCPEELGDWEQEKLMAGFPTLERRSEFIDVQDGLGMDFGQIARSATRSVRNGARLVVLDYIQLIDRLSKDSRAERLAAISREIKALLRSLGVPGIILSQLSRDCEKAGRKPNLSDLRDSGGLEQDADIVWFLHRDYQDRSSQLRDFAQAKGRNQGIGDAVLFYDLTGQQFAEAVDEDGAPLKPRAPRKRGLDSDGDSE